LPTASDDVESVALPEPRAAVPNVVEPSRKVTVPVGVPVAGATAVTVAVNVTVCPKTDGLTDEVTVVELTPFTTVCVRAADVLLVKLLSPA
jgi:hypothetical protein